MKTKMKFIVLAVFGFAMGIMESIIVVYIRKIIEGIDIINLTGLVISKVPIKLIRIEQIRETCTIIMLITLSLLVEKGKWRRMAVFLWTFAVWDIVYYIGLKTFLNWPPSLATIDCLFLIPCPWIAPVYVPIIASTLMIIASIIITSRLESNVPSLREK